MTYFPEVSYPDLTTENLSIVVIVKMNKINQDATAPPNAHWRADE